MIYDFYNGYQIDATDIDCGKVIYVDCYGMHMYKSVCELFDECDFTWPAINWCRMIPGINANQPGIPGAVPGYILTVNPAGTCVQRTDPHNIFPGYVDEKVKASATDPVAGYLNAKLISSDLSVSINLIAGGSILDLTVNLPTYPTFPNISGACANGSFLMATPSGYYLQCDYRDLYASRYLPTDTTVAVPADDIVYPIVDGFIYQGHPLMQQDSAGDPPVNGIKIIRNGMYHVWFNAGAFIDDSVRAIRFMLWSNNTGDGLDKTLLLNAKAGVEPGGGLCIIDTTRGIEGEYISFSESGLFRLDAGNYITMVMRVDSLDCPAGSIIVEGQGLIEQHGTGSNRAPAGTVAKKYCGTSFGVSFYTEKKHPTVK